MKNLIQNMIILVMFTLFPLSEIVANDNKNDPNAKGFALLKLGKYEEAVESFDLAIKYEPSYYDAYYYKGVALKALGKDDEAKKCFNKAQELRP